MLVGDLLDFGTDDVVTGSKDPDPNNDYTYETPEGAVRGFLHAARYTALQELLISTSLADSLVYQFSSRLVAIWADHVDALVEEMEKRGYTPRIQ